MVALGGTTELAGAPFTTLVNAGRGQTQICDIRNGPLPLINPHKPSWAFFLKNPNSSQEA